MKKKLLPLFFILSVLSAFGQNITFTTTSNRSTWSPVTVVNSGATLRWTASGGGITQQIVDADDPTFNLSANTGIVTITVESTDSFIGLSELSVYSTAISNSLMITGIDISAAKQLDAIRLDNNSLPYNELDKLLIDLDANGLENGNLIIGQQITRSTLTYNSLASYTSLIAKGWTIDVGAPAPMNLQTVTFSTNSKSAAWTPYLL